jgi:hypothetical protein
LHEIISDCLALECTKICYARINFGNQTYAVLLLLFSKQH